MPVKTGCLTTAIGVLSIASALTQAAAFAQVTPEPSPVGKPVIPQNQGTPVQSGRSESLSRKLSNSGGVIKPNDNVDPGMNVPVPSSDRHSTPVIPPSATGGNTAK